MNMKKIATVLLGVLLIMSACKNTKEKVTPKGLKFTLLKEGNGVPAKVNEVIVYNLITKDSKDSVWSNTYTKTFPGLFFIKDSTEVEKEDGFTQMFRMVSRGDSILVTMPVKTLFKEYVNMPVPKEIDSTLDVSYLMKIEEILDEPHFREYQSKLIEKKTSTQRVADEKEIREWLAKTNVDATRDSSGIYYKIHESKGSQKPLENDCVTVSYKGTLMQNGNVFDQNKDISFGLNQVISGWRIAIPKMGIGDSATFYIPSELAYGPRGAAGAIPPDAVLIFDVRLHKIGKIDQKTGNCN